MKYFEQLKKRRILFFLLGGVVFGVAFIAVPRSYGSPELKANKAVQYWTLESGNTIAYYHLESTKEKKKSPIIYLHGGPGGRVSERSLEALSPLTQLGHDVFLYDQMGSGFSERLNDINQYSALNHTKDLKEIVRKIGAKEVILLGQSWGAMLASLYLLEEPNRVEKMVLTGPGPILPINKSVKNQSPPDSLNIRKPKFSNKELSAEVYDIRARSFTKIARLFGYKLASDKEADDFANVLFSKVNQSAVLNLEKLKNPYTGAGYYAHIMTVNSFQEIPDRRNELGKITTPILIMKGQFDNQKWGYTQEYLDRFPNSQLRVIPDAGHFIELENYQEYYKELALFLKE